MESDEIHEILGIKSHEIQWDVMKWNPMGSDERNPMGSDEIHEILSIKPHEIQWDLMKFMRF